MERIYRFQLEKGSKKHHCPECGKKTFVAYIDTISSDDVPMRYGRCDREIKCGHHESPYPEYAQLISDRERGYTGTPLQLKPRKPRTAPKAPPQKVHLPVDVLRSLQSDYSQNTFIQNLLHKVDHPLELEAVRKVVSLYQIGTMQNGYNAGAVAFPFIEHQGNVRAIQLKQFDESNHTTSTGFIHSSIEAEHRSTGTTPPDWLKAYCAQDSKVDCLFGEHLLSKHKYNHIALVEAPKTAIYATLYFGFPDNPQNLLWLAVFNLSSLNVQRCEVLAGRTVHLFPDLSAPKTGQLSAFELWQRKAEELNERIPGARFKTSDLLERNASPEQRAAGCDLADYLIKHNWREYCEHRRVPSFDISAPEMVNVDSVDNAPQNKYIFSQSLEDLLCESKTYTTEYEEHRIRVRSLRARREALRAECESLESTFVQAAQRCRVQWYAPAYIAEPPSTHRLRELKYWTL